MGQTRVNLHHLLEDLRDAYPGPLEETILVEITANALDSGAARVCFFTDPAARTLVVVDDGRGMSRRELSRYHDLATTSKMRGKGIGFAGVGIKLGLLACDEVLTESRSARAHARKRKRPGRFGLHIQFENRPGEHELGRLVESTVLVNEAHPAYQRAAASRSEAYHLALTVGMVLAPLAVEPKHVHTFVTEFLALWGEAARKPGGRR
jgi:hypothetical protein